MKNSLFRTIVGGVILMISMFLVWILGFNFALYGGEGLHRAILPEPPTILHILYGIIEFLVGVVFFILLRRQILPGGMRELWSEQITLYKKAKYFPGIFALGVFAGLAGDAVIIFVQEIILYLR